jgi:DNA repair photolyase
VVNDHAIPPFLAVAKAAGTGRAYTEFQRLPLTVVPILGEELEQNVPWKHERVLNQIRAMRGAHLAPDLSLNWWRILLERRALSGHSFGERKSKNHQ